MVRLGSDRYAKRVRNGGQASFQAEAESAGLSRSQEILELGTVPAPALVAEWYEIEPDADLFARRRRTWLADDPTQLADSYYVPEIVEGTAITAEDSGPGGSYARLDEAGHRIERFREELQARPPTPEEAKGLHLHPGAPVIELHRIAYAARVQSRCSDPYSPATGTPSPTRFEDPE